MTSFIQMTGNQLIHKVSPRTYYKRNETQDKIEADLVVVNCGIIDCDEIQLRLILMIKNEDTNFVEDSENHDKDSP